ncbi:MAG: aspartate aminotransferase family protein [Clostridia bacterium]|nr:aspartate aminotransferase family protein [Clostridia bacterium]
MKTSDLGEKYVMKTYNRFPLTFEKGEGMYVYDENGKKYLDFVAGIAVNSLGHNHPKLVKAISEQASKLIHISNLYYTEPQVKLAQKLVENGSLDKVFFCNSGAESIESALKLARKYGSKTGRQEIITMHQSFHGRTFGAVTATGQDHYHEGFGDMLPHIKYAKFNDFKSVRDAVNENTIAILMEPVQGEGGIIPAEKEFLQQVRQLCDEKDILLMFDEVQCGVGRLGTLFAYEAFGVVPDIMSTAKGIAGGIPCGIMMAKAKVAEAFVPGDHASTFGGNPLAASAGNVVVDELSGGLLDNVKKQGTYLREKLEEIAAKHSDLITDVRGMGLMQGIELNKAAGPYISKAIDMGLLLVGAGKFIIRFVPSLIVSEKDIDKAMEILDKALTE